MDTNSMILVAVLLFVAVLIIVVILAQKPRQYQQTPEKPRKTAHLETSKQVLGVLLLVWAIGGLVGLWQVLFRDPDQLEQVLSYIQSTVQLGLGGYLAKAGAENWKKLSPTTTTTKKEDITHEQ